MFGNAGDLLGMMMAALNSPDFGKCVSSACGVEYVQCASVTYCLLYCIGIQLQQSRAVADMQFLSAFGPFTSCTLSLLFVYAQYEFLFRCRRGNAPCKHITQCSSCGST